MFLLCPFQGADRAKAYLHIVSPENLKSVEDGLVLLTPHWSFSTKNPPVVQLRATKPVVAYEGELAVAFKLRKSKRAAPKRASATDIPRDPDPEHKVQQEQEAGCRGTLTCPLIPHTIGPVA